MKKVLKKSLSIIVSLALVLSLFLPYLGSETELTSYAASKTVVSSSQKGVTTANVNLRAGTSLKSKILLVVKKDTNVEIIKSYTNWYKVKLQNGKIGFIYKKYVSINNSSTAKVNTPAAEVPKSKIESTMTLATTTSTQDTGLLDYLIPIFEKKYSTSVKVIAVGTGEALEMGKRGDADVVLVHARKSEDEFVSSGYGINRKDVMYNSFFIVGPKDDPAKIANEKDAQTALKKIADSKATFISRGDQSGTHKKELALWQKYSIKPQGENWYLESAQGMGDTLMMASEKGAYTLVDSGTWYAFESKLNLKVVVQGDKDLFNPYGVIAVNPEKNKNVHKNAAMAFVEFLTSKEGQKFIGDYKKEGKQLFTPNAQN